MIERNSYTLMQKFGWNFVRHLLFGGGGLAISKDQHTPRIMQPSLRPTSAFSGRKEIGLGHCCTPQDSYNPPARTTQCIQRRENYFMRNSRWNCIYGEPVAGFVVDSCCNCLIYMKIGNSREPTHVISLLRCTIILLKGNSMRIFDLRWFICAALSIRDKIFFHFRLGK